MNKPTIGRIVHYKLSQYDKEYLANYETHQKSNNSSDILPAIIVTVWNEETGLINAQVIVDGQSGLMWKTSITQGNEPGQWNWPEIK